jgi:hypothetical protein
MGLRELKDEDQPDRWAGLEVSLNRAARPTVHVEFARPDLFRLVIGVRIGLIARVEAGWRGLWWWRPHDATTPRIFPPIRAATARAIGSNLPAWARHIATQLPTSPIAYPGSWRLMLPSSREHPFGDRPLSERLEACLEVFGGRTAWSLSGSGAVYALRAVDSASARCKAWRKVARDGVLPPILLFFVSGIDSWLLIDGHDRLAAGLLEGRPPTVLLLSSVIEKRWPHGARDQTERIRGLEHRARHPPANALQLAELNQQAIAVFREPRVVVARTRAWALPGGADAWWEAVRARLADGAPRELLGDDANP